MDGYTRTKGYIVYALLEPNSDAVRYVGRSSSGLARPLNHWRCRQVREKPDAVHSWVRELLARRKRPRVAVLQVLSPSDDVSEKLDRAEAFWLKHFQLLGEPLLNSWLVDPFDEEPTPRRTGWRHSKLTRRKIGRAHAGKAVTWRQRQNLSKGHDREKKPVACLSTGQWFPSVHAAAKGLRICVSRVSAVCNQKPGARTAHGRVLVFV